MAPGPFRRLARVELQLVLQHCDKVTLLRLARCSRSTLAAASQPFAWRCDSPLELRCDSPLELSPRVAASLLRHADLSVRWDTRPQANAVHSRDVEGATPNETEEEQRDAQAEAEAAALAALPGLRRFEMWEGSAGVARVCSALLARLGDGCALAGLHIHMRDWQLAGAECRALGALVARSRTLTALSTDGNLDSEAVRLLADGVRQSRSLVTLRLIDSRRLGDAGAAELASALAHRRTLTDLQLSDCKIGDGGVEALVAALCQEDSNLRALNLSDNSFSHVGAAAVARLLADRCGLQSLDLSRCAIGDAGAESLAEALRANRTLTRLQLGNLRIGTQRTAALAAALQSNCRIPLRHLDLSGNPTDTAGAASLAQCLRAAPTIERLDLGACGLNDAAVAALAAGLPAARSLRELRLVQNTFSVAGAAALAAGIQACPAVTLLQVKQNWSLGDGGLAALAPALAQLRAFDARNSGLTGASAAALASLLQPSCQLQTLHLSFNAIGTAGAAAMAAALQPSSPLRTLHLFGCDVGAEAAAALGEALLRGWAGTELQLSSNPKIGDDGARALAATLEQRGSGCSLRTLSLDFSLAAAGALALVRAAAAVPSLRALSVRSHLELGVRAADDPALRAARGAAAHFVLQM